MESTISSPPSSSALCSLSSISGKAPLLTSAWPSLASSLAEESDGGLTSESFLIGTYCLVVKLDNLLVGRTGLFPVAAKSDATLVVVGVDDDDDDDALRTSFEMITL